MKRIKFILSLIKESFSEFMNDNALKLSAALSYYTIFSLAPMLLVIISMVSIFFGKEASQGQLFGQISALVGKDAAIQLQEIIKNAEVSNKSTTAATIGVITLLIGATGVFAEIQDSINYIWSIKSKPKKSWLQYLKNRLLSFSIIITLGFLLIVSLGVNTFVDLLSQRLENRFSEVSVILFSALNIALVLIIITALFTVIFKILPDGHVRWKECLVGAAFTAIMFAIGKFAITFYLGKADLGATYGTSASIVILLTWVYYSSIILYFGAEFTKVYAKSDGVAISPNEHAVIIVRNEMVAQGNSSASVPLLQKIVKNGIFDKVTDLVDEKINAVKTEIKTRLSAIAAPATFYGVTAIVAFIVTIVLVLLLGQLLNRLFNSDFLGYVVLLGLTIAVLAVTIMNGKKIMSFLRRSIIKSNTHQQ